MVLPDSHRVPRVPRYSGHFPKEPNTFHLRGFHPLWPTIPNRSTRCSVCNSSAMPYHRLENAYNPTCTTHKGYHIHMVWANPRSLAATKGISVDFFSCGYLDVSVHRVRFLHLCIQYRILSKLSGFPHSEIPGSKVVWHLTEAYRSLQRPSSPLTA